MNDAAPKPATPPPATPPPGCATWGPKLFAAALALVLVFFWWLLIYSHGVVPHHG